MTRKKKKPFELATEIRAIARERVGPVPAGQPIQPKSARKKPKHKKPVEDQDE